jgi:hypothetical protein
LVGFELDVVPFRPTDNGSPEIVVGERGGQSDVQGELGCNVPHIVTQFYIAQDACANLPPQHRRDCDDG